MTRAQVEEFLRFRESFREIIPHDVRAILSEQEITDKALELAKLARSISKGNERACSEQLSDRTQALYNRREASVRALCMVLGLASRLLLQSDPRGSAVRLYLHPSERRMANGWDGDTLHVPEV